MSAALAESFEQRIKQFTNADVSVSVENGQLLVCGDGPAVGAAYAFLSRVPGLRHIQTVDAGGLSVSEYRYA